MNMSYLLQFFLIRRVILALTFQIPLLLYHTIHYPHYLAGIMFQLLVIRQLTLISLQVHRRPTLISQLVHKFT